eukprot:TRINITY_DN17648_c0_g1_i3.p2 TRINITY_DN17648_c0_g1~~TRINITY_DN17648_c0_g1_i3.p2  ORF type:complete len:108 (-),score=35.29 TRINITY_DN17648_c0_g1_i3:367-690(-)
MAVATDKQLHDYFQSILNLPPEQIAEWRPLMNGKSIREMQELIRTEGSMFDLWCDTIGADMEEAEEAGKDLARRDPEFREMYFQAFQMWTDDPVPRDEDGFVIFEEE